MIRVIIYFLNCWISPNSCKLNRFSPGHWNAGPLFGEDRCVRGEHVDVIPEIRWSRWDLVRHNETG